MKVLIVGSGAREHALAWRLRQSPAVTAIWAASGNGGTAQIATNLNVSPEDVESIPKYAKGLGIDLVVVGPEQPLAAGLVDLLDSQGIPAFGPTKAAAQIEASKSFALDIMRESGVPCPEFHSFQDETLALDFLSKHSAPSVIKADGLAAGKGVFMCHTAEDAAGAVRACMSQKVFGGAGDTVVIEEFLEGPEVSVFAFSDGEHLSAPVAACDYKRRSDGDEGPNTGGMGSFAPPDFWSEELAGEITRTIMEPVIQGLARRGSPYHGVLYAGIMLTKQGPKVLEFNCRFGDPETQVIMPLLVSDPLDIMTACIEGQLAEFPVEWSKRNYAGVVMVSDGYPDKYETGFEITGLDDDVKNTTVFHAATRLESGKVVTSGGRVLTVVGSGESLAEARDAAYHRVRNIGFQGASYRSDIADLEGRTRLWLPDPAAPTG